MRPRQLRIEVHHLRLEPQPELHASLVHQLDQRVQSVGPDSVVDEPVAKAGARIPATVEPTVVEHEPLDADPRSAVDEVGQPVEIVVEVDSLPAVECQRPRT